MSYLCHLVISIAVISVINHFSLNWNVRICILVEYFGGSRWIPWANSLFHAQGSTSLMASLRSTKHPPDVARVGPWNSLPDKVKTDRMACVAAKSVPMNLPHPPIIQICVQTFLEKTNMITSWKIFPANLMMKRTIVAKSLSGCYRS